LHDGALEHDRRVWQYELLAYFGMLGTVDDLSKWMIALTEGRLVKPETLDQMWTATKLKGGNPAEPYGMPYGMDWFTLNLSGHRIVGHPGFLGPVIFHYVDDDFTVVVLTNLDVASGSHEVALAQAIISRLRPNLPRFVP
jgi:hypothetical protein